MSAQFSLQRGRRFFIELGLKSGQPQVEIDGFKLGIRLTRERELFGRHLEVSTVRPQQTELVVRPGNHA